MHFDVSSPTVTLSLFSRAGRSLATRTGGADTAAGTEAARPTTPHIPRRPSSGLSEAYVYHMILGEHSAGRPASERAAMHRALVGSPSSPSRGLSGTSARTSTPMSMTSPLVSAAGPSGAGSLSGSTSSPPPPRRSLSLSVALIVVALALGFVAGAAVLFGGGAQVNEINVNSKRARVANHLGFMREGHAPLEQRDVGVSSLIPVSDTLTSQVSDTRSMVPRDAADGTQADRADTKSTMLRRGRDATTAAVKETQTRARSEVGVDVPSSPSLQVSVSPPPLPAQSNDDSLPLPPMKPPSPLRSARPAQPAPDRASITILSNTASSTQTSSLQGEPWVWSRSPTPPSTFQPIDLLATLQHQVITAKSNIDCTEWNCTCQGVSDK
jgi:hypothetical protein